MSPVRAPAFGRFASAGGVATDTPDASVGTAISLASAPDGFWSDIQDNRGYQYNGRSYFGWVDGSSGDVQVAWYDNAAGTVSPATSVGTAVGGVDGNPDLHDSPSVVVTTGGTVVVAYSAHQGTAPVVRVASSGESTSSFGAVQSLSGSGAVTYATLQRLDSGTIYLFYRRSTGGTEHLAYRTSTTGGTSWSSESLLFKPTADVGCYWKIATNGTRIDIAIGDTKREVTNPSAVYHFYLSGGTAYRTDGSAITGSLPFTPASATLVKSADEGTININGMGYDGGTPVVLMSVWDSANSDNLIKVARWGGSSWATNAITTSNGIVGTNRFISSATLDPANANRCWISRKVGSTFEMFRATSADSGATWSMTALTSGSSLNNVMPGYIGASGSALRVIWGYGTYTNDQSFSFGIKGAGD